MPVKVLKGDEMQQLKRGDRVMFRGLEREVRAVSYAHDARQATVAFSRAGNEATGPVETVEQIALLTPAAFPPLGVTEADVDRAFGIAPCLGCAREESAAAGFGGIDRIQPDRLHSCGAPPAIYALDGEPLADLEKFIRTNTDPDAPGLSVEQVEEIRHMMPGDTLHLGGGAGETFTLTRRR